VLLILGIVYFLLKFKDKSWKLIYCK
jgi:hypothetical protein